MNNKEENKFPLFNFVSGSIKGVVEFFVFLIVGKK